MENQRIKFGVTQAFPCNYLEGQTEQLLVLMDKQLINPTTYSEMIAIGFRRSGESIYRPHCGDCNACQSIRIPVEQFKFSKSQKRIWNKNSDLKIKISHSNQPNYYPIYEQYINNIHKDGSMYPATEEQYEGFLPATWLETIYLEMWDNDTLVAVCVTDNLSNSLSALYTFYSPDYTQFSLGTFAILQQIELCKKMGKSFLYLGYQIDECNKMNYKQKFLPHHRLIDGKWQLITALNQGKIIL